MTTGLEVINFRQVKMYLFKRKLRMDHHINVWCDEEEDEELRFDSNQEEPRPIDIQLVNWTAQEVLK